MTVQTFRMSNETCDALRSIKGVRLAAIATDSIFFYEGRDFLGCHEIGFRNDAEKRVTSFKTQWKTVGNEDIHLFDFTPESGSRIPRAFSDGKPLSVGPCSWVELASASEVEAVEIAELEFPDLIWDWGIVLRLKDGRQISFSTDFNSILGEIEIRLSGQLRAPEYGDCALRLKTLLN